MSRYELMFGAISVVMICRVPPAQPRDVHELPRLQRERLRPDRPRRPRPRRQPDEDRLGRVAVHVDVRGDDDEDRERRDDEDDVREHVQDVVDPAAPIAGGEADRGAEEPGDPAADDADEEGGSQPVDELREHVLAERRRPEPVLRRRRLVGRPAELERRVVREQRPDERERRGTRGRRRGRARTSSSGARSSELRSVRRDRAERRPLREPWSPSFECGPALRSTTPRRGPRRPSRAALHPDARARVDEDVRDVDDEVRDQDTGDEEEEDPLDEEVVAILDRVQGQRAEARIGEDDLDDDRAGDDRAEREREAGDLREERVPVGVLADELRRALRAARGSSSSRPRARR